MNKYVQRSAAAFALTALAGWLFFPAAVQAAPEKTDETSVQAEYEAYYDRFLSIENRDGIAGGGFLVVEDQIFPLDPDDEESILMVPAFDEKYNRLALFIVDVDGQILYRTEQLEKNTASGDGCGSPCRPLRRSPFRI